MSEEFDGLDQYDFINDDYLPKVREKYSSAIGNFLIIFSALELAINIAIAEGINRQSHAPGYAVVERLTTQNKIDLLSKLYLPLAHHHKKITSLKKITKELKEINLFRNLIVHAGWFSLTKDNYVRSKIVVDDEGSVKFKKVKITQAIIKEKVKNAALLSLEIEDFTQKLLNG